MCNAYINSMYVLEMSPLRVILCSYLLLLYFFIGNSTILSEKLSKLQESLSSAKHTCQSSEVSEESQKIIQPVIDSSLAESYSVAWALRNAKHVASMKNENLLQGNKTLREEVDELQRKGSYTIIYNRI